MMLSRGYYYSESDFNMRHQYSQALLDSGKLVLYKAESFCLFQNIVISAKANYCLLEVRPHVTMASGNYFNNTATDKSEVNFLMATDNKTAILPWLFTYLLNSDKNGFTTKEELLRELYVWNVISFDKLNFIN